MFAYIAGHGVYTTAEGDVYTGEWELDKLGGVEPVTIAFTDASTYVGNFKDWSYTGNGTYTFHDESVLACTFRYCE